MLVRYRANGLIGQEVRPSSIVADRIDLLATEEDGTVVIIELKRGSNRFQLGQSLSYAAMMAKLQSHEVAELAGVDKGAPTPSIGTDGNVPQFKNRQRIILVAEELTMRL